MCVMYKAFSESIMSYRLCCVLCRGGKKSELIEEDDVLEVNCV